MRPFVSVELPHTDGAKHRPSISHRGVEPSPEAEDERKRRRRHLCDVSERLTPRVVIVSETLNLQTVQSNNNYKMMMTCQCFVDLYNNNNNNVTNGF